MADLSKIKLNGTSYDIKDNIIRDSSKFIPRLYIENYGMGFENDPTNTYYTLYKTSLQEGQGEKYKLNDFYNGSSRESHLVWLEVFNGEDTNSYLCLLSRASYSYNHYFILQQINGLNKSYTFRTNDWGTDGLNGDAKIQFSSVKELPTLEPMVNVEAMLTSFGLNASANLTPAQAGTAEVGKAVVQ